MKFSTQTMAAIACASTIVSAAPKGKENKPKELKDIDAVKLNDKLHKFNDGVRGCQGDAHDFDGSLKQAFKFKDHAYDLGDIMKDVTKICKEGKPLNAADSDMVTKEAHIIVFETGKLMEMSCDKKEMHSDFYIKKIGTGFDYLKESSDKFWTSCGEKMTSENGDANRQQWIADQKVANEQIEKARISFKKH